MFCASYFYRIFHISVIGYTGCACFEVKDEEDLLLEKSVRGYKTGRRKRRSKWPWNLWERRMTPAPDNFMHQTGSLTASTLCENLHVYSYKTPIKKAQPNFLQTTRKVEIILTLFITVLTLSFLLLSTSWAIVEFYKLTTLDKMILLAVKLSRLDVSSTQLKQAFNFPFNYFFALGQRKQ